MIRDSIIVKGIYRIRWKIDDLIDVILDKLSPDKRWAFIEFCMSHKLLNPCRADAYFWSEQPREQSIFELGQCNFCSGQEYTYCGMEQE